MSSEEIKPYDSLSAKGAQVEAMFDNIAPAYDFMNTAMTFGLHRRWLRKALESVLERWKESEAPGRTPLPEDIIDLATGTGDVAFRLSDMLPSARILGVDLSEGMLKVARSKVDTLARKRDIRFEQGDCLQLACPDNSFDLLTIAYGVRNFENLEKGFREFFRVLRPGALFMILELSRPENRIVRPGYDLYARGVIPLIGRMVSKDRRAYTYLPESIAAMPSRRAVAEMLTSVGFKNVTFKSLTMGVVTFYIGMK